MNLGGTHFNPNNVLIYFVAFDYKYIFLEALVVWVDDVFLQRGFELDFAKCLEYIQLATIMKSILIGRFSRL